jgi:hypothetical protein
MNGDDRFLKSAGCIKLFNLVKTVQRTCPWRRILARKEDVPSDLARDKGEPLQTLRSLLRETVGANDQDSGGLRLGLAPPNDGAKKDAHHQRQGEQGQDSTHEQAAGKDCVAAEEQNRQENAAGCNQSLERRLGARALP